MEEKGNNNELKMRILSFELLDHPPPLKKHAYNLQDVSFLRLVGKTMDDKNVSVWASGHNPYFFLEAPEYWDDYHCSLLRDVIVDNVKNAGVNLMKCELQMSHRTYGFTDGKLFPFVKLTFRGIKSMIQCRRFFETPLRLEWSVPPNHPPNTPVPPILFQICEQSNKVPDSLKVIHDTLIQPSGWVSINTQNATHVPNESTCHLNLHTDLKWITPFESDDIPNFIEMSFDGEMISPSFEFPRSEKPYDIISMISLNFRRNREETPFYQALLCLGPQSKIEGVDVRCFEKESDLLWDFLSLVQKYDPDIWTGYNINKFDIPYIMRRAKKLGLPPSFFNFGRFYNEPSQLVISYKSKQKFGRNVSSDHKKVVFNTVKIGGRRIEDAYLGVKNQMKKLTSYKLDNVANFYLNEGKHPVEPEDIFLAYQDITDHMQCSDNNSVLNHFLTEVRLMSIFDKVTRSKNMSDPQNIAHFYKDKDGSHVGTHFSEAYIVEKIVNHWPAQYKDQIVKVLGDVFRVLNVKRCPVLECSSAMSYEDCEKMLRQYIEHRTRANVLMFGPVMLNLAENWFNKGITMSQIPSESTTDAKELLQTLLTTPTKVTRKTKREREEEENDKEGSESLSRDDGYFDLFFKQWEDRIQAEVDVYNTVITKKTTKKFAQKWWRLNKDISLFLEGKLNVYAGNTVENAQRIFDEHLERHLKWLKDEKDRIGSYCVQDAALPPKLRRKQQHGLALMEMSRITYVPCDMIQEKGQTIKVINLYNMWARKNNYVITYTKIPDVFFKGGQVLQPVKKFWMCRVFTLDFSSLYPSLIQENKLCYLSLILPGTEHLYLNRPDLEINSINIGEPSNQIYHWVQNRRVALPEILEFLVSERGRVKVELEVEKDPIRKIILDQRQNAIKLVGNSAYGFTGYIHSPWPCMPIAVCTCKKGRDSIFTAKRKAEDNFRANVIYGDSVTHDTPILCRLGQKYIGYTLISELPRETNWIEREDGKQYASPSKDLEVWTEKGFTKLNQIIRHETEKRIFAVKTESSYVTVTEDHSLLDVNAEKVSPKDLTIGFPLLHSKYLEHIETYDEVVHKIAYTMGLFYGSGSCFFEIKESDTQNRQAKIAAQWLINCDDYDKLVVCKEQLDSVFDTVSFIIKNAHEKGPFYLTVTPSRRFDHVTSKSEFYKFLEYWQDSFYCYNGQKCVPVGIINAPRGDVANFLRGYHGARVDCFASVDVEGQITTASLFYLYEKVGLSPKLKDINHSVTGMKELTLCHEQNPLKAWGNDTNGNCRVDISHHFEKEHTVLNIGQKIVQMQDVTDCYKGRFVYDLETHNHHFGAGIGKMIVHNTDSIMAIVPIPDEIVTDVEKMQFVFNTAKEAAADISSSFKKPMKIVFEKVYFPYFLQSKKKYSGLKWTKVDRPDGVDTKGIEAIRRDNCAILRNTVLAILKVLMEQMDISKALQIARNSFRLLAEQKVPWDDLVISKQLGDDYKTEQLIQVQVAKYLEENYPLLAPEAGDRVQYVVIKTKGETKHTKAYTKGFDPVLAQREGHEIDWFYYAFKQLRGPLTRMFCVLYGLQPNKDIDKPQPTDYLWSPYLDQIRDNNQLQQQRVNGQNVMDKFIPQKKVKEWHQPDEKSLLEPKKEKVVVMKQKNADIRSMFVKNK